MVRYNFLGTIMCDFLNSVPSKQEAGKDANLSFPVWALKLAAQIFDGQAGNKNGKEIEPRSHDLGSISTMNANTFFTIRSVRICAFW